MNYYNPYFSFMPYAAPARAGLFSRLLGGGRISFSSILGGANKALNIANQAIPIIKQASPMLRNAKTMLNVMNEFKKNDTVDNQVNTNSDVNVSSTNYKEEEKAISTTTNNPTFFA